MEQDSRRAILAVILSGIVLFSWQYFFPQTAVITPTVENDGKITETTSPVAQSKTDSTDMKIVKPTNDSEPVQHLKTYTLKANEFSYTIDSHLNVVESKSINSDKIFPAIFEETQSSLLLDINGNEFKPFFIFTKTGEASYTFVNIDNNLRGAISLADNGMLDVQINSDSEFKFKFITKANQIELENSQKNQFMVLGKDLETFTVGSDDMIDAANINWYGQDFNYHFYGHIFPEKPMGRVKILESGQMNVSSINPARNLNYKIIFLQKNYDDLLGLGYKLDLSVDFGIMAVVAIPILRGLQFFYTVFPNYGISIILLTIFIRMLTFPLQYKSFKSMKKMQVIQPELTALRAKHKDNPQQMQKETMALFKKAGANPLGGCLPLLLQMPVFFAFYRVLYSAVELVDAKFIFWIVDLSEKDPYFVLPVLMSAAMFLNMKLTPQTSADPAQQKIMMFMPLFFGFIMKDLPAGLTLYIFVSTVMGMLQQLFVYKRVS